ALVMTERLILNMVSSGNSDESDYEPLKRKSRGFGTPRPRVALLSCEAKKTSSHPSYGTELAIFPYEPVHVELPKVRNLDLLIESFQKEGLEFRLNYGAHIKILGEPADPYALTNIFPAPTWNPL
ncbi:hypothetical protein HAX54_036641, partial [Datura stramonium]|nr:hypothetical protein [Datura stramonium]